MNTSGIPVRHLKIPFIFNCLLLINLISAQQTNESVFYTSRSNPSGWQAYTSPYNTLYRQISAEAFQLLEERKAVVDSLKTESDWINYRKNLRSKIYAGLTEFKKTPLNPEITGKTVREDCTIEKVVFQSFPNFHVTGCLFIPRERQNPGPSIIYCSGHNSDGFRNETYLRVILNLVNKGFIVFAFDPIGQGERLQYPGEDGKSMMGGPTTEHSFAGIQTLLTGHSLSDYFIWDGVRAVDYLLTRPEVDAGRIGITGRSGGGTQSAMIAAYDERIYAAAPECYITAFRRLFESMGPQDAEQNPFQAIRYGFDHADFFHLRAPLPSLMVTTSNDIFSIQGAREVYQEATRSYQALRRPGNMIMVEDFGVHESTLKNREAVYAFFQRHLNLKGSPTEMKINFPDNSELKVTPTGQVVTSYMSMTVFDLNKNFIPSLTYSGTDKVTLRKKISEIAGFVESQDPEDLVYTGRLRKEDFYIDKYIIRGMNCRYGIPFFLAKSPAADNKKMVVLLASEGKSVLNTREGLTAKFARLGFLILSPDLPGTGELEFSDFRGDSFVKGKSYNHFFSANLIGKSISGIQATDLQMIINTIKKIHNLENRDIIVIAENETCIPVLLWTITAEELNAINLVKPVSSLTSLAETRIYNPDFMMSSIPGALRFFDLPSLLAALTPVPVALINPLDGAGSPLKDLSPLNVAREAYSRNRSAGQFQIQQLKDEEIWDYVYQKIANSL